MRPRGDIYLVTLRARPSNVPGIIRLRRFLKIALRAFGLVAEDVRLIAPTPGGSDVAQAPPFTSRPAGGSADASGKAAAKVGEDRRFAGES